MLNMARVVDFLESPVLFLYGRASSQGIRSHPGVSGGGYGGTRPPLNRRRERRWGRTLAWLVGILLLCYFFLPGILRSVLMPNYLDMTSEIVVAQVSSVKTHVPGEVYVIYNLERSGRLVNNLHYVYSELVSDVLFQRSRARLYIMCATIVLYDKDGHQTFNRSLLVEGDTLNLQGDMIQYAAALNAMGFHSGYRITGWQKQYGGCQDEPSIINNAMPMDGSHDNFFRFVQENTWLSPLVGARHDPGVSVPLDGKTHQVLLLQRGLRVID